VAPSGKKTTGQRPALKTGEFKSAKTSPGIQSPAADEPSITEGGDLDAATGAGADMAALQPKTASGKSKATTGQRPALKSTTTSSRKAVPDEAARARVRSGAAIWLICRECHEEFTADPARATAVETLVCPGCGHISQTPNDDVLHQIALYKGIESRNLTMGAVTFGVGCLAMLAWTLMTTKPDSVDDFAVFTLPLIVAGLSTVATLFFLSKYENSRWETYF